MKIDSSQLQAAFEWLRSPSSFPFAAEFYLLDREEVPGEARIVTLYRSSGDSARSRDGSLELRLPPPPLAAEDAYECPDSQEFDSDWSAWDGCPDDLPEK